MKKDNVVSKDKKEIDFFTKKIDEMLSDNDGNNNDDETKINESEVNEKTPDDYWKGRYCALANSICRGPGCMQWDFTAYNVILESYGDCAITNLNTNLQYLCVGIKEIIRNQKENTESIENEFNNNNYPNTHHYTQPNTEPNMKINKKNKKNKIKKINKIKEIKENSFFQIFTKIWFDFYFEKFKTKPIFN